MRRGDALLYERFLPALAPCVGRMRRELVGMLASNDLAQRRRDDIALVLTEAATNVVTHAYGPGTLGPLYTSVTLQQATLTVSVVDFGRGLAAPSSPGGGFGLVLLRELSDELQIASNEPEPGTSVHASFDRVRQAATQIAAFAAKQRAEVLREYVAVLRASHESLQQETEAVFAQTSQALAHARRRQLERARFNRRG